MRSLNVRIEIKQIEEIGKLLQEDVLFVYGGPSKIPVYWTLMFTEPPVFEAARYLLRDFYKTRAQAQ
jgi:hypothetical protein